MATRDDGVVRLGDPDEDFDWRADAACLSVDPDLFHPEPGQLGNAARRICQSCEVTAECLSFALENDIRWGIYGNTSPAERKAMKRQQQAS